MTTFKEKIIKLSRNEIIKKFMTVYSIITFVVIIMSYFFEMEPIVSIVSTGAIILWTIYGVLFAIKGQEIEVVKNNKLINITLSDELVIFCYIMFYICCPIMQIISDFVEYKIIARTIIILFSMVGSAKLSNLISKHFKNKLKK